MGIVYGARVTYGAEVTLEQLVELGFPGAQDALDGRESAEEVHPPEPLKVLYASGNSWSGEEGTLVLCVVVGETTYGSREADMGAGACVDRYLRLVKAETLLKAMGLEEPRMRLGVTVS